VLIRGRQLGADDGQLTLLIIGYTAIAAVLVVVGIDASKVFLARRALSSAADSAALAGAQAVDRSAVYSGRGGGCGSLLPLDGDRADLLARMTLDDDHADLEQTFAALDAPTTVVTGGTVTVHLSGIVAVPFGHVVSLLLPGHGDGLVHVDASASAQSPLAVPGAC
jgi:hypothetical protein